jgi:hypothetical protein
MHPLFAIPVHVKAHPGSEMPKDTHGIMAYAVCYSAAEDEDAAFRQALDSLAEDHYEFIEMNGEITELDTDFWMEYVAATWPEDRVGFHTIEDITSLQKSGGVLYSPFCCYPDEN